MIQRVQSLYLLGAAGLLFSMFFKDFFYGAESLTYMQYVPFKVLTIVTFILSFISVFLYRNRIRQMRVCVYNMILLLCYQGWILYMFFTAVEGVKHSISAVFPVIAFIFTVMAFRGIKKDELLVQSSNSLRDISKKVNQIKKKK